MDLWMPFNPPLFFFMRPLDMGENPAYSKPNKKKTESTIAAGFLATGCKATLEKQHIIFIVLRPA